MARRPSPGEAYSNQALFERSADPIFVLNRQRRVRYVNPAWEKLARWQRGMGERLVRCRTMLGLSQKVFAGQLGVDQGTLARWEQGKREPAGAFLARVKRLRPTVQHGSSLPKLLDQLSRPR